MSFTGVFTEWLLNENFVMKENKSTGKLRNMSIGHAKILFSHNEVSFKHPARKEFTTFPLCNYELSQWSCG